MKKRLAEVYSLGTEANKFVEYLRERHFQNLRGKIYLWKHEVSVKLTIKELIDSPSNIYAGKITGGLDDAVLIVYTDNRDRAYKHAVSRLQKAAKEFQLKAQ